MAEAVLEDRLARGNAMSPCQLTQAQEREVLGKLLNPIARCRRRYPHAELFAHAGDDVGQRLKSVVPREGLDDHAHRIRSIPGGAWREAPVTEATPVELHRAVLRGARAVFHDRATFAVRTREGRLDGVSRGATRCALTLWGWGCCGMAGHSGMVKCLCNTILSKKVKPCHDRRAVASPV